jgi:UDP-glucose 4-epimerase
MKPKILVTGGAGFIGSTLSAYLIQAGHTVHVLDNLSTGRRENLANLAAHDAFQFTEGDASDRATVEPLMAACDYCFHLAAPVGVKYIMQHPVHTILGNIRATDVVLELANRHKKRVLIASTSEVYGKSLDLLDPTGQAKLQEDDYRIEGSTRNHRWAYANTKALDEFLALAYHKEYGLETVVVRFFNTVGPRQLSQYGMVLPTFIQRALRNQPIQVYGSGTQKRSFLHVNDAVRAICQLMETPAAFGQVFNLGNPFEIAIKDLAARVIELTDSPSQVEFVPYQEAYGPGFEDMDRRTADISKLQSYLDFTLQYDLTAIIRDIIAYQQEKVASS